MIFVDNKDSRPLEPATPDAQLYMDPPFPDELAQKVLLPEF